MERRLYTKDEVISLIENGNVMVLSADETLLNDLPKGNWIAGTTPYFMDKTQGCFSKEMIFVDDFTELVDDFKIETFTHENIKNISKGSFENGFILAAFPSDSPVLNEFALNSLSYDNVFNNPLVGFVSGSSFDEPTKAKVYNGALNDVYEDKAAVMYLKLPDNRISRTEIINLDSIKPDSDEIVFPISSFTQSACEINGKPSNIAEYLTSVNKNANPPHILISNTNGALINRDVREVNIETGEVTFYSPAYSGDKYFLNKSTDDYQALFNERLSEVKEKAVYSSICVSYYLLGELQGKNIDAEGAFAFGEIAYQLLNKTMVLLFIDEV